MFYVVLIYSLFSLEDKVLSDGTLLAVTYEVIRKINLVVKDFVFPLGPDNLIYNTSLAITTPFLWNLLLEETIFLPI